MAISFPNLETKDLILREITEKDAEDYFALCSDDTVMRTWGTHPHETRAQTLELIQLHRNNYAAGRAIRWGMERKEDGRLIGDIGFWRFVPERFRAEAGAKLAKAYWSSGYMTAALTAIVRFGFESLGLHSVEANVDPNNPGALRLVEKVGFLKEGYLREHSFCTFTKKFRDTALFSVVKSSWHPPAL